MRLKPSFGRTMLTIAAALCAVGSARCATAQDTRYGARDTRAGMYDYDRAWMDDSIMIDPASMGYPTAAPASLHLYHWSDYTQSELMHGSATDHQMMNEQSMDEERRNRMGYNMGGDPMWRHRDPSSVDYPTAAPAGVHLYHWSDYTQSDLMHGSATEHQMMNEQSMDEERRNRMGYNMAGGMYGDPWWIADPAGMNYPIAAPGALHLYHWSDYTQSELMHGSATEHQMMNEQRQDQMRRERTRRNGHM